MTTLSGYHALITGGGTGIGAAIARALTGAGAAVSIAGRRREPLAAVANELARTTAITANVTDESDCAAMIAAANAAHGPVDLLIVNAGAAESVPFAKADLCHWQRMIDVNLTGAFLTTKAVLRDLARPEPGRPGRIIFIASTAGLKGYRYVAAYTAAKHGVVGLARALAIELAPRGVTVNAVCPGFTETSLLDGALANITDKTGRSRAEAEAELARANPQGRLMRPEEIAATVLWLCGPSAQAITGQAISVSGGEV